MINLTDPLLGRIHPGVHVSNDGYSVLVSQEMELTRRDKPGIVSHVVTCISGKDNLLINSTFKDGCRIKGEFEDTVLKQFQWDEIYGAVEQRHYLCHDADLLCQLCQNAEVKIGEEACYECLGEKAPLGPVVPFFIELRRDIIGG